MLWFYQDSFRLRRFLLSAIVAALCSCSTFSSNAVATDKDRQHQSKGSSRAVAAAAKAKRARMISSIQHQIADARQVLKAAESKSEMTKAQMLEASSRLSGIQREIDSTHGDAVEAAKTLREIEAELILEQSPTSELSVAQAAADEAKKILDETIQAVLNLPAEDIEQGVDVGETEREQLSDSQLNALQADSRYTAANESFKVAARFVSETRQKLFLADPDWIDARQDLTDAHRAEQEGEKQQRVTGNTAYDKKTKLQNAKEVAASARSIISRGESRLRKLGVTTKAEKTTKQEPSKK